MGPTAVRLAAVVALLFVATPAVAVTEIELISRARQGESADLLIARIEKDRTVFLLEDADVDRLLAAGLPRELVDFMRETPVFFRAAAPDAPSAPGDAGAPAATPPMATRARTTLADVLEVVRLNVSDQAKVGMLARRHPLVALSDADAEAIRQAGASPALIRYIRAKSEGDQQRATTSSPSPRKWSTGYPDADQAGRKEPEPSTFTDSGNVIISGGVALQRVTLKGGGSATALSFSPRVGVFVIDGLLLELELTFTVQEGPDVVAFLFDPGYYIRVGRSGAVALFGQALVGYTKAGSAGGPAGGLRLGLAIAPGEEVGPVIRIGPTLLWSKSSIGDGDDRITVKARTMTFGTDFGVWF